MRYYARESTATLQVWRDNLTRGCREASARKASGEVFESAYHYESFIGAWREDARRLKLIEEELLARSRQDMDPARKLRAEQNRRDGEFMASLVSAKHETKE